MGVWGSNQLFYYQFAPHLLRLRCFLLFPFFVFCTTKKTRDRPFVPKDTALICVLGSDRNVQEKHQKPSVRLCPVSYLYEFCTFFSEKERFEDVQGSGSETYSGSNPSKNRHTTPPRPGSKGPRCACQFQVAKLVLQVDNEMLTEMIIGRPQCVLSV